MSARYFPNALELFGNADLDWLVHNIKAKLLKLDGSLTDTVVKAITGVTVATPAVGTVGSTTGWTTGDLVCVRGVVGTTSFNQVGILQVINGTTFSLKTLTGNLDVVGVGTYVSGGCAINLTLADFRDDLDAAEVGTASSNLANKTNVDGVLDADDPAGMTLNDTAHALMLYRDVGSAATDPPIHFQDGKIQVVCAADAAGSATTMFVDPLAGALDDNTVLVFSNGVTAQLNGAASAGARSITVDALSGAIAAHHTAEAPTTNQGFPITSGGGPVAPAFDNGANKIGKI